MPQQEKDPYLDDEETAIIQLEKQHLELSSGSANSTLPLSDAVCRSPLPTSEILWLSWFLDAL
eukprot:4450013-Amphidinium_carterae.1